MQAPEMIDSSTPYVGTCALCGAEDSRHRIWDSVVGRYDAGESAEDLAYDYGMRFEIIMMIALWWNDAAQAWDDRAFAKQALANMRPTDE